MKPIDIFQGVYNFIKITPTGWKYQLHVWDKNEEEMKYKRKMKRNIQGKRGIKKGKNFK